MDSRKCKTCGEEKRLDGFRKHIKKCRSYWEYECRVCAVARSIRWNKANRERTRAKARERYANDAAYRLRKIAAGSGPKRVEKARQWRAKNLASVAATSRRWRAKNPEHSRLLSKRRRAKVQGARVEAVRKEDIADLFVRQRGRCVACGKKLKRYHIDHIVPLARGGDHGRRNLQLLCPSCNLSKSSKDPIAFMQENGFLL